MSAAEFSQDSIPRIRQAPGPRRFRAFQTGIRLAAIVVSCLFLRTASAAELRLTGVERLTNNLVRLTFEDTGIGALNYKPALRSGLDAGSTRQIDPSSRVTELTPGSYQTTIADPAGPAAFFQIAGFPPPDADEDGLSDALENLVGTSTNTFDTDGDGFGDANELVNGGDPLRASSRPDVVRVNFASAGSSGREGDGTLMIPFTTSRTFNGTVRYSVATMSTASSGTDFGALTGVVDVNGTNGAIPIVLVDDLSIEDVKLLVIDLANDAGLAYQTGAASRHSILLHDNDAYWSGVLRQEESEQAFRMRMLRQGGTIQAALVSNFDTNNTAAMQGVGSIPPGVWSLTSATLTSNTFAAVSIPIPMGVSTLFGESALDRVLSFDARPGTGTNNLVTPNLILGTFTDRLSPANAAMAYLGVQSTGIFVLMEELPVLPVPDLPALPAGAPALAGPGRMEVRR